MAKLFASEAASGALQQVAPDPRRLRLHARVPRRALPARREDLRDRRGHERGAAHGDRAPAAAPAAGGALARAGGPGHADPLVAGVRAGDVRAIARAITLVEDGRKEAARGPRGPLPAHREGARRRRHRPARRRQVDPGRPADGAPAPSRAGRVGVVAVDPTSPFSGGAILGDRIRMQAPRHRPRRVHPRRWRRAATSAASPRRRTTWSRCSTAAGKDVVLVETVGVGQDEVEVVGTADVTVVVLVPGLGDEVQAMKAGIMEIADVFVVNKADRDGRRPRGRGGPVDAVARPGPARRAGDREDGRPPGPGAPRRCSTRSSASARRRRRSGALARRVRSQARRRLEGRGSARLDERVRRDVAHGGGDGGGGRAARRVASVDPHTAADAILARAGLA